MSTDPGDFGKIKGMADLPEILTQETLDEWSEVVKEELGLSVFNLSLYREGDIKLDSIIIAKDRQDQGWGSRAMEALTDLADHFERTIWLSPAERDSYHGTTSKGRLQKFYKRFGFVMNRGRRKDYRHMESMYRRPVEL